MKLYAAATWSPFTSRARLAVYARGLDVPICTVPGDTVKSPEFLAINPLGRIPALALDDGTVIVESEVIVEYFEDHFSQKPLRPASPEDRARARMIARVCDFYVMEVARPLTTQLSPANRDQALIDLTFDALDQQLAHLDGFLGAGPYAVGASLSTADCAVAPMLAVMHGLSVALGRPKLLGGHPKIAAYLAFIGTNPHVARVLTEMREGIAMRLNAA